MAEDLQQTDVQQLLQGQAQADAGAPCLPALKRHQVEWNILMTVHAVNGDEVYRFLRDESGRQVHPVHPDRRACDSGDAGSREQGLGE